MMHVKFKDLKVFLEDASYKITLYRMNDFESHGEPQGNWDKVTFRVG